MELLGLLKLMGLLELLGLVGRGTLTIDSSRSSASFSGTGDISVGTSKFCCPGSLSTPTRDLKVTPEDSLRVNLGDTLTFGEETFSGCGALFELFSLPPYVRDGGTALFLKNDLEGFLYLTGRFFLSFFCCFLVDSLGFLIGFEGFFVFVFFLGGGAGVVTGGANENGAAAGVVNFGTSTGAVKLK